MPVLVLLALALTSGAAAGFVAWRYPRIARPSATPALAAARRAGETVGRHPSLRAVLHARLDPAVATGLALTVALVLAIGGGLLLGFLAYLVRTNSHLIRIDNSVAKWGHRHASPTSMHVLKDITQLGSIYTVIGLCVVLAVAETIRERSVWVTPFIVSVIGGEEILTTTVKQLADRVRPTFNPAAASPSNGSAGASVISSSSGRSGIADQLNAVGHNRLQPALPVGGHFAGPHDLDPSGHSTAPMFTAPPTETIPRFRPPSPCSRRRSSAPRSSQLKRP